MIEPLPAYQARCQAWHDQREALVRSYQRESGPRESWMSPDANLGVIEQRVNAAMGPYPERLITRVNVPSLGKVLTFVFPQEMAGG